MSLSQRIYYVNTLLKHSGTNQDFAYQFQIPQHEEYDRVVVLSASIPNTFYLVQEGFNTFTLVEDSINTIITIPPGNYSARVFALVVAPLMTTASPNGWVYTITLPNQNLEASTGKFTYFVTGNISQPSIVCTDQVNEQLGFSTFSTNSFVGGSLVSTTTVNFAAESTLFIHSDIADNGDSDVLQEIYGGNTTSLSYITYQCNTPEMYSKVFHNTKSNIFHFSLTNEKKQLLNLHGVDMQLTLCLYKRDNTNEWVRKYLKYKADSESSA